MVVRDSVISSASFRTCQTYSEQRSTIWARTLVTFILLYSFFCSFTYLIHCSNYLLPHVYCMTMLTLWSSSNSSSIIISSTQMKNLDGFQSSLHANFLLFLLWPSQLRTCFWLCNISFLQNPSETIEHIWSAFRNCSTWTTDVSSNTVSLQLSDHMLQGVMYSVGWSECYLLPK